MLQIHGDKVRKVLNMGQAKGVSPVVE